MSRSVETSRRFASSKLLGFVAKLFTIHKDQPGYVSECTDEVPEICRFTGVEITIIWTCRSNRT